MLVENDDAGVSVRKVLVFVVVTPPLVTAVAVTV
jgi:hypothetical protein